MLMSLVCCLPEVNYCWLSLVCCLPEVNYCWLSLVCLQLTLGASYSRRQSSAPAASQTSPTLQWGRQTGTFGCSDWMFGCSDWMFGCSDWMFGCSDWITCVPVSVLVTERCERETGHCDEVGDVWLKACLVWLWEMEEDFWGISVISLNAKLSPELEEDTKSASHKEVNNC